MSSYREQGMASPSLMWNFPGKRDARSRYRTPARVSRRRILRKPHPLLM